MLEWFRWSRPLEGQVRATQTLRNRNRKKIRKRAYRRTLISIRDAPVYPVRTYFVPPASLKRKSLED